MSAPKFKIGQLISHQRFGYRGVVYDIDTEFSLSNEWYEQVAHSCPPKDAPWYRVLVHDATHETYVAEQNLEADASGEPVLHPQIDSEFDAFRDGYYARQKNLN